MPSVEEDLAARTARGDEVVLATVIKVDGEPPSRPGAKILLSRTATLAGTLGCSEFDSAALADAAEVAGAAAPQLRTYRHDLGSIEAGKIALGPMELSYQREFANYRKADVSSKVTVPK